MLHYVTTPTLRIAYQTGGPDGGEPVLLLHGWPDNAHTYDKVAPALHARGMRTIAPFLRGFGETAFLSPDTMRSGEMVAMAQDALDFVDALGLDRFAVVGHDWGARIGYALAACFPERITRLVAMSVAWQGAELPTPDFEQARLYWYHWFMATDRGAEEVRRRRKEFARIMWDTWAPKGWYDEAQFEAAARSFENSDWADITIHSYRVRWGEAGKDRTHAALEARLRAAQSIAVPTLVIHGAADGVTLPSATEGRERYFTGEYRRELLPGVGHFPTREAPDQVGRLLSEFLAQ